MNLKKGVPWLKVGLVRNFGQANQELMAVHNNLREASEALARVTRHTDIVVVNRTVFGTRYLKATDFNTNTGRPILGPL